MQIEKIDANTIRIFDLSAMCSATSIEATVTEESALLTNSDADCNGTVSTLLRQEVSGNLSIRHQVYFAGGGSLSSSAEKL